MGDLVPWPGIKSMPPASEVRSLNHWTGQGSPSVDFLTIWCCYSFPFFKERNHILFIYLAVSHGLWDLSTPNRDQTQNSCSKSRKSCYLSQVVAICVPSPWMQENPCICFDSQNVIVASLSHKQRYSIHLLLSLHLPWGPGRHVVRKSTPHGDTTQNSSLSWGSG